jgi:hypothetical protein
LNDADASELFEGQLALAIAESLVDADASRRDFGMNTPDTT